LLAKRLAGGITLVAGAWMVVAVYHFSTVTQSCVAGASCPAPYSVYSSMVPALAIGLLLVADSVLGLIERWAAYPAGAVLSVLSIAVLLPNLGGAGLDYELVSIVLGIIALVLDVRATLVRPEIAEENHPLNLPVFG
jgi:hypothetical protein